MKYTATPIFVRADTPVSECIKMMRENDVGSVLVMADTGDGQLIGIFTERDLLKKIALIQNGDHWDAPVRTVMTSPVKTLDASKIHLAGKLMIQHRFRHIPIVSTDQEGKERVVGIVSMRDVVKSIVIQQENKNREEEEDNKKPGKLRIALITKNDVFSDFLQQTFESLLKVKIKRIDIDEDYGNKSLTVIVDIDEFENEKWPSKLQLLSKDPKVRLIIVAMDPSKHPPELLKILNTLGKSRKFWIFKKPLEIFDLMNRLKP